MRTITVTIPDRMSETEARSNIDRLFSDDWIAEWWSTDDVQGERPDLTDDQAREVLRLVDRQHDAEIGINWQFIRDIADMLYEEPEEDEEELEEN